jgi:hypothetical protein
VKRWPFEHLIVTVSPACRRDFETPALVTTEDGQKVPFNREFRLPDVIEVDPLNPCSRVGSVSEEPQYRGPLVARLESCPKHTHEIERERGRQPRRRAQIGTQEGGQHGDAGDGPAGHADHRYGERCRSGRLGR